MKNLNKLLLLLSLIIVIIFSLGCSKTSKYNEAFNSYVEKWLKSDFSGMYSMLTKESKESINEETFVNRYKTIYSAINLDNLDISLNKDLEKKDNYYTASFTLKATTIAGELNLTNFDVDIYKEEDNYLLIGMRV